MKPITRVGQTEEEWQLEQAKIIQNAALKEKEGQMKYEAYLKKHNSPEEVARRNAEQKERQRKLAVLSAKQKKESKIWEKRDAADRRENSRIGNKQYFFMIENQIRDLFPSYEVRNLLPLAEDVLKTSNINFGELQDYPIEGYYYKNSDLKKYFKIARNLQENAGLWKRVKQAESCFKSLKSTTDLELFGKVVSDKHNGTAILPRRYDILALSARDEKVFDIYSLKPGWNIPKLVDNLQNHFTNTPNLVELAYLTRELEPLICGAETNALYRDLVRTKGMAPRKEWAVDKEVEAMGKAIIEEYNKRFRLSAKVPTESNHSDLSMKPERPRVAVVGNIIQTGENYFWKSDLDGNVTDIYTREFLTTESEKKRLQAEEGIEN